MYYIECISNIIYYTSNNINSNIISVYYNNNIVIGFGGAANMVHPSTGYHACRMMAAASDVAKVIGNELNNDRIDNTDSTSSSNAISSSSASTTSTLSAGSCSKPGIPDKIAALAYKTMWNQQNRGQRDFQVRFI